ncbi:MAG: hypothetical protein IPM66_02945 [Acidobacteriota bacterium]|nr:MAG: hypothetical protein IPM66_02945 [Acidobacteriota bacterium]
MITVPALAAGNNTSASNKSAKSGKRDNPPQVIGQLTVYGAVTVNDKKAINGTTVFTDSRIKVACAKGNRAIVNLGAMGRVELNPGAQLVLRYSDNLISGDLIEGNILVNSSPGVKVSINTSEGVTATDGQEAQVIPVRTQRGVRCVPMVMTSSSQTPVLNSAAIAAILLGAAGAAVAGTVVSTDTGSVVSPSN